MTDNIYDFDPTLTARQLADVEDAIWDRALVTADKAEFDPEWLAEFADDPTVDMADPARDAVEWLLQNAAEDACDEWQEGGNYDWGIDGRNRMNRLDTILRQQGMEQIG